MRNQSIRDKYAALSALAQRALPGTNAISRIDSLLKRFEIPYNATEKAKKKIIADHPVPETWEREGLPLPIAEVRQLEMDAMLEESQNIKKIPEHMRLTDADMPIALKRESGSDNIIGLAQIKRMLGSLYKPTTEEEKKFVTAAAEADKSDELEPDEYTEPSTDPRKPD